jgi:hypothetical protein
MAMDGLWTLRSALEELDGPSLRLDICTADKAYDAHAFHSLLLELGVRAVIPLKDGAKTPPVEGLTLDDNGRPVCPAGLSARWHGTDRNSGIQTFNCPVKRPGKQGFVAHIRSAPTRSSASRTRRWGRSGTFVPRMNQGSTMRFRGSRRFTWRGTTDAAPWSGTSRGPRRARALESAATEGCT